MGYRRASMMRGGGGDWYGLLTALGFIGITRMLNNDNGGRGGCGCGSVMMLLVVAAIIQFVFVTPTQLVLDWAVKKYEMPVRRTEERKVHEWADSARVQAWAYHDTLSNRCLNTDGGAYSLYEDSLQQAWNEIESIEEVIKNPPTPKADRIHVTIIVCVVLAWVFFISACVFLTWLIKRE